MESIRHGASPSGGLRPIHRQELPGLRNIASGRNGAKACSALLTALPSHAGPSAAAHPAGQT